MSNTFLHFEHKDSGVDLAVIAIVDKNKTERTTAFVISNKFDALTIGLSEKEVKELISALQARVDGHINAFSGTFNQ